MHVDHSGILVDCKVTFEKKKYNVDDEVRVWVYIKCKSQFSMRFSHLQLIFDDEVSHMIDLVTNSQSSLAYLLLSLNITLNTSLAHINGTFFIQHPSLTCAYFHFFSEV